MLILALNWSELFNEGVLNPRDHSVGKGVWKHKRVIFKHELNTVNCVHLLPPLVLTTHNWCTDGKDCVKILVITRSKQKFSFNQSAVDC